MSLLRAEVLSLYRRILRLSMKWEAVDPIQTKVERNYLREEAQTLFRKNKQLTNSEEIRRCILEGEARMSMAEHYRNPYPRPVNLPKTTFAKREGKKIGKAILKVQEMSRPVYLKSTDDFISDKGGGNKKGTSSSQ